MRQVQLAEIAGPSESEYASDLQPLATALKNQYGETLLAIVFYGSCLRSGDLYGGLIDFYVIVDDYRRAHGSAVSAFFNRLIPPNVYYLESRAEHGTLRAKYAVLSMRQLERGTQYWFQSGVWGRFAQPLAIVYAQDSDHRQQVRAACGQAVLTLLTRALPALPRKLTSEAAFTGALSLSYASELRVEGKSRGSVLITENADEFARRWTLALPLLPYRYTQTLDGASEFSIPARIERTAKFAWPLRRIQGKVLSVLRLAKACFTFSGAIDYAAWKLERHTGEKIEVTPRLRRYPLIFAWPVLWRLYRRRVLR